MGVGSSGEGEATDIVEGEDAGEGPDTGEVVGPLEAQFQLETEKAAALADRME